MLTKNLSRLTALCAIFGTSVAANAALVYDANVTNNVIMGTGIANGGFAVSTNNGVEIGLRARERYDLANNLPTNVTGSNANGTYNQNVGTATGNRARWNFDWSINTGTAPIGSYTYRLGMDYDPGVGTNYQMFDLINVPFADHSFGNSATSQSAGTEATTLADYAALLASSNLVQNSWNLDFFDNLTYAFNPTLNGTYSFFLEAREIGRGALLARTDIDVIVGTGAVPEPGTLALIGLALAGLAVSRRRA